MRSKVCKASKRSIVKGDILFASNLTTHAHACTRETQRTREAKILNHRKRTEFLDALRYKRTRQGGFEAAMWHLDHPLPGGGRMLEASDRGKGAAEIRSACEEVPRWMKLWREAAAKLPRTGRRVLEALLVDWRTAVAARIAGVSRPTVDHWKKQFKIIFSQCFQAYKRDFKQK